VAEITKSHVANLGSQQDLSLIKHALEADGELKVVDDPEPEPEEDEEGNELPPAQTIAGPTAIKVDADEKAAKEAEKEAAAEAKAAEKEAKAAAKA